MRRLKLKIYSLQFLINKQQYCMSMKEKSKMRKLNLKIHLGRF